MRNAVDCIPCHPSLRRRLRACADVSRSELLSCAAARRPRSRWVPPVQARCRRAPRPPPATAVTRRYCRPPSSYIDGDPLVVPPSGKLPQLLAGRAVVDVDLAIGGRDEHQARGGRDDPALGRRRRARARDALTDETQIVAEPDLPLDRALVEIVRGQRGVRRIDDRRVEAEAVRDVASLLHDLRRAAAPSGAHLARLQESDDRRHVEADDVHAAVGRIGGRAAPVRSALVAGHVNHVVEPDRREGPVVPRLQDALPELLALLRRQDVRIQIVRRELLARERRRARRKRLRRPQHFTGDRRSSAARAAPRSARSAVP